ncbi:MAG: FMN-binding negative transcriptional regulator [Rhizobium sp.]|nr:FMN-binding negative transcriptional regulator [Rhizobium sp.]
MYQPPLFKEERIDVMHGLIRAHPFGLVISVGPDGDALANGLPLLLDSTAGEKGTIRGHFARANPQWKRLDETGRALVVFQGPYAYITPSWYESKREHGKVVPTWNYVMVQARGRVTIHQDPEWLRSHVSGLTDVHEAGRGDAWAVADAPDDFIAGQVRGIVGFEMEVTSLEGKWKVSQNRSGADRRGVVAGLSGNADSDMAGLVAAAGPVS